MKLCKSNWSSDHQQMWLAMIVKHGLDNAGLSLSCWYSYTFS